ncbi:MAG: thiamine phosphate synthase [Actinobacteria bacterium]|nr:thiamine phosphate synthase [Actinomycetota bacterium]
MNTRVDDLAIGQRRLYLCTPDRPDLADFVAACIDGGVDIVQLREKHLEARALLERAAVVRGVCRDRGVPFILNDRPDLALDADADGVHVGQDDARPALARRILGHGKIVGYSTHASRELDASGREPVDYVATGPVVHTATHPDRAPTGVDYITYAARTSTKPFFVTGGVTPEAIPALASAGARRFVVVRYLTEAGDPRAAARRLRDAIDAVDPHGS